MRARREGGLRVTPEDRDTAIDYHVARATTERARATAAGDPHVAAIHAELAARYDERVARLRAGTDPAGPGSAGSGIVP